MGARVLPSMIIKKLFRVVFSRHLSAASFLLASAFGIANLESRVMLCSVHVHSTVKNYRSPKKTSKNDDI